MDQTSKLAAILLPIAAGLIIASAIAAAVAPPVDNQPDDDQTSVYVEPAYDEDPSDKVAPSTLDPSATEAEPDPEAEVDILALNIGVQADLARIDSQLDLYAVHNRGAYPLTEEELDFFSQNYIYDLVHQPTGKPYSINQAAGSEYQIVDYRLGYTCDNHRPVPASLRHAGTYSLSLTLPSGADYCTSN